MGLIIFWSATPHHLHEKLIHIDSLIWIYIYYTIINETANVIDCKALCRFLFIRFLSSSVARLLRLRYSGRPSARHHMNHFIYFFFFPNAIWSIFSRRTHLLLFICVLLRVKTFWKYSLFRTWIATKGFENKSVTYFGLELFYYFRYCRSFFFLSFSSLEYQELCWGARVDSVQCSCRRRRRISAKFLGEQKL